MQRLVKPARRIVAGASPRLVQRRPHNASEELPAGHAALALPNTKQALRRYLAGNHQFMRYARGNVPAFVKVGDEFVTVKQVDQYFVSGRHSVLKEVLFRNIFPSTLIGIVGGAATAAVAVTQYIDPSLHSVVLAAGAFGALVGATGVFSSNGKLVDKIAIGGLLIGMSGALAMLLGLGLNEGLHFAVAHGVTTVATFGFGVLAPITLVNLISIPKVYKYLKALNAFDQMSLEKFILDHPEEMIPFLEKDLPNDLNRAMAPIREKIRTARAELQELTQIKAKLTDPASTEFSANEKVERLATIEKTIPKIERQLIDWQKNLNPVDGVLNESIPNLLALVKNRLRLQKARDDVDDALARITGNAAQSSVDLEENEEQIKIAIERLAKVLSDFDAASKAQHEVAMLPSANTP